MGFDIFMIIFGVGYVVFRIFKDSAGGDSGKAAGGCVGFLLTGVALLCLTGYVGPFIHDLIGEVAWNILLLVIVLPVAIIGISTEVKEKREKNNPNSGTEKKQPPKPYSPPRFPRDSDSEREDAMMSAFAPKEYFMSKSRKEE